MIFVTGDTHGLQDFDKLNIFAGEHPELTRDDCVVIAGDFGAVWSSETLVMQLRPYTELPFTVLFVDGNHENFDLLNTFPVEIWNGGKIRRIRSNVIHLTRGQVFTIDNKTVFTFGGATSVDKEMRREGISWWKQESPSFDDLDEGIANLKRYENKVDYIITHGCGQRALEYLKTKISVGDKAFGVEVNFLSNFEDVVTFKHWYFGHYHFDRRLSDKFTAIYGNIERLI